MLILILINVQYLQNVVFSFENGLNGQNLSSSDSYHLIFPPAGGDFPYLLLLFGQRWRVVPSKHLKYGTKKAPFAASLIYWFSMFLLTVLHMKPRNFVKSQVQMFHFLNLKIWSKSACHMYGNTEASIYIIYIYILPNLLLRTKISFNKHCHKLKNNQCPTKCYQYFSNRVKVYFSSLDKHYI